MKYEELAGYSLPDLVSVLPMDCIAIASRLPARFSHWEASARDERREMRGERSQDISFSFPLCFRATSLIVATGLFDERSHWLASPSWLQLSLGSDTSHLPWPCVPEGGNDFWLLTVPRCSALNSTLIFVYSSISKVSSFKQTTWILFPAGNLNNSG